MLNAPSLPNTVMFTIATEGYLPFVWNLHASLARIGLGDSLVIYTLDEESHLELSAELSATVRYPLAQAHRGNSFGTAEFARTMSYKYAVALDILKSGRHALYADSDIVFLRNPFGYLELMLADPGVDLAMQVEAPSGVFNAGFWLAKAVPAVMEPFEHLRNQLAQATTYLSDQKTLNAWVKERGVPRIRGLDPELFACGNQFLKGVPLSRGGYHIDRSVRPFPFDEAYLLHFNFLINEAQKISAMARHGAIFHRRLESQVGLQTRIVRWLRRLGSGTPDRS